MARLRVPESYKGGRTQWVADVAQVMQVKQQSLANLTRPGRPDTHMRTEGLVECWFSLGLYRLLRALVATLEARGAGEAARRALVTYERSIRDMADFYEIYPVVLDLESAFPAVFTA